MERQEERPRRIPMPPPADLPPSAGTDAEPPFLRPKHRTRIIKRARRGVAGRALVALQSGGLALLVVAALWAGYSKVMASERLRVGRVAVHGNHFLSEGEVRELLGPAVGENILGLDIDALKARLRASPWVADATVRRTLPDTIQVEIRERIPLALAEADGLYLMDEEGTLIDLYGPRTAGFDLPIVRGLANTTGDARRDRAQRAGALLGDLEELGSEISEVQVEESGDLRLVLRGRGEVLKMGAPPYKKKFVTFLGLRGDLAERAPHAEYFDLRFRDRIYAKQPTEALAIAASAPSMKTSAPEVRGR
jgi:cell division septal protein FtsQ